MATFPGATISLPLGRITSVDLADNADIAASQLAQNVLADHRIPMSAMRVWDNMASLPPSTAAADDLALVTGTPGTDAPKISADDLKAAGATSRKIAFEQVVPPNYDDGQTIQIRVRAGMETTVADVSATVDLEVFVADRDGAVGADICTTSAQSCNSLTLADLDFTLTAASVDPGDRLICVLTLAVNDAATGTAVTAVVTSLSAMMDTRG